MPFPVCSRKTASLSSPCHDSVLNEKEGPEEEANTQTVSEVEGTAPSEAACSGKSRPRDPNLMVGAFPAPDMGGLFKVQSGDGV